MPGLFDNQNGPYAGGGILSGLGNFFGGIGAAMNPAIQENQFRQQAYNALAQDPHQGPGNAALLMANPQAYGMNFQQRIMQQNYDDLVKSGVPPALAGMMATHPEMITKLGEIQKLGPGEAPYNALAGMLGTGGPTSQQQGPPSSQPAGGSIPGMGPANMIGTISDDAAKEVAIQARAGDPNAMSGAFFAGPQGNNNRTKVINMMAQMDAAEGRDPLQTSRNRAGFKAYEQGLDRLTTVQTNMGTAQMEAQRLMPLLEKAVNDYYGQTGQFPPINKVMQAVSKNVGDPRVIQIGAYINALRNTYARGISTRPQGPTVNDKNNFDEVLQEHWAPGQIRSAFDAITKEFQAAHDSIPAMKNQLNAQTGLGKDMPDDILKQAKDAIAAGKPRERIIQRLQEHGYNANGL